MDYDFLSKIALFSRLSKDEIKQVACNFKKVKVKGGDVIFLEDSSGDDLYILTAGEVQISKKMTLLEEDDDRIEKTLITLKSSDYAFFGEVGLLGKQLRTASVIAKTDCELYSIGHDDFTKIIKESPKIGSEILWQIALKLAKILEKTDSDILKLTTALIYALKQ
jgi:CRP-like cAMP-binding protein